jgi:hypothetical protein
LLLAFGFWLSRGGNITFGCHVRWQMTFELKGAMSVMPMNFLLSLLIFARKRCFICSCVYLVLLGLEYQIIHSFTVFQEALMSLSPLTIKKLSLVVSWLYIYFSRDYDAWSYKSNSYKQATHHSTQTLLP